MYIESTVMYITGTRSRLQEEKMKRIASASGATRGAGLSLKLGSRKRFCLPAATLFQLLLHLGDALLEIRGFDRPQLQRHEGSQPGVDPGGEACPRRGQ